MYRNAHSIKDQMYSLIKKTYNAVKNYVLDEIKSDLFLKPLAYIMGMDIFDYRLDEDLEMHDYNWFVERIKEFDQYANVETKVIGKSINGYDLYGIDIIPENDPVGQIIVVAGHHGTEPAGPEAAIKFVEKVLDSETNLCKEMKKNYRISVIPIVDVDQYVLPPDKRADGDEYNSNYSHLHNASPEVRATADFVSSRADLNYLITFDLHEDFHFKGFGILEHIHEPKKNYARRSTKKLQNEGYRICHSTFFRRGVSRPSEASDTLATSLWNYWLNTTFMGFSYRMGGDAYTFETPGSYPLKSRVEMHLLGMETILSKILDKKFKD